MKYKFIFIVVLLLVTSLCVKAQREVVSGRTKTKQAINKCNDNTRVVIERKPGSAGSHSNRFRTDNNSKRDERNSTVRERVKERVEIYKDRTPPPESKPTMTIIRPKRDFYQRPIKPNPIIFDDPYYFERINLKIKNVNVEFDFTDDTNEYLEDIYKIEVLVEPISRDFYESFGIIIEYHDGSEQFISFNRNRDFLKVFNQYTFNDEIVIEPNQTGYVDIYLAYYDNSEYEFFRANTKPFLCYISKKGK